jgi:hypothetical protein
MKRYVKCLGIRNTSLELNKIYEIIIIHGHMISVKNEKFGTPDCYYYDDRFSKPFIMDRNEKLKRILE